MNAARPALRDAWTEVQWPSERAATWARRITRNKNVRAIVAIGSAARGRARPVSDVDLIIVCSDARSKVVAPPEVDARWVGVASLRACVRKGDDVVAWGVVFGAVLYDPVEVWSRVVARWRDRLPLPSPQACMQRAARARRYATELLEAGDEDAASEQALTMLTHEARLVLSRCGVFPASRPELVQQLKSVGATKLASLLARALEGTLPPRDALERSAKLHEGRKVTTARRDHGSRERRAAAMS